MDDILLFLSDRFPDLLDVNLTASIVILFVIGVRLLLKRAPKIFSYALWAIVLLRLLVPISIESPVSVIPEQPAFSATVNVNEVLPEVQFETPGDRADNAWHQENTPPGEPLLQVSHSIDPQIYLTLIWLAGIVFMLLRSGVSYWKLRKRVRVVIPFQKGIYLADDIDTPFVMGFFRPAVYLPGTLDPSERKFIIAHERHHIRRGDHIFKALGYLALTVHWFNPLVWVAFVLASRDMEMSCDEAVIQKLGADVRAEYSASLLNLATGHRLFTGTPLAFGEGDPTGRVRNLAKWKKPAFWVILLCVVICIVMAVCLLTNPELAIPKEPDPEETVSTSPSETTPAEDDWGVSIILNSFTRTDAEVTFTNTGKKGTRLRYNDSFTLERLVDGNWVAADELAGYDPKATDATYPVRDGRSLYHDWVDRFGTLTDGDYRLGKPILLEGPNKTSEERMYYATFTLNSTRHPLQDFPRTYDTAEFILSGGYIQSDGMALRVIGDDRLDNHGNFYKFAATVQSGVPSSIRIINQYYSPKEYFTVSDLTFDGSMYTITWQEDGEIYTKQFQYLKHFTGDLEQESSEYDHYEYYVLVNDDTVTWPDLWEGLISSRHGAYIDHMTVFSDYSYDGRYSYDYETTPIPESLVQADLSFEGEVLVTTIDSDSLEKIHQMFSTAEVLGYEPKTHSTGLGLHLILTAQSGETVTIDLDVDNDLCRIDGAYMHYGVYDEPNYISKLWQCLGISAWPDPVYEKYPNAFPVSFSA